ncbi:MAG: nucleotidyltransferase family protein [Pseudomonadota bacterium]
MKENRFLEIVNENPLNRLILERLPDLGLNDCWLVSGALFQTAWNIITGRPPTNGIRDYDVFYFDDSDLSWEAEDYQIKRATSAFSDIDATVEVRNQARVYLWYTQKYGLPYPPLTRSTESIDRFLAKTCMVGLCPGRGSRPRLYAPVGLQDVSEMVVQPNYSENFQVHRYREKAARWLRCWPELMVVHPEV